MWVLEGRGSLCGAHQPVGDHVEKLKLADFEEMSEWEGARLWLENTVLSEVVKAEMMKSP